MTVVCYVVLCWCVTLWVTLCVWRYVGDGVVDGVGDGVWVTVGHDVWVTQCGWWYVGDSVGDGVRVTLCGLRCAGTVCVCVWVTTWVTLCDLWCDGDDVRITLRGKHYVADAVEMTLRGWWCVSIHTGVKTQFRISKWIAHVSVLYNIDVTCQRGNDTTCCIILHAVLRHFPHTMK